MKYLLYISLSGLLFFSNMNCMSMMGMQGMHGGNNSHQMDHNIKTIQKDFQNEKFTLSMEIQPQYVNIVSNIKLSVKYNSMRNKADVSRFLVTVQESNSDYTNSIEITGKGIYPIKYVPKEPGMMLLTVKLIQEDNAPALIEVQQIILAKQNSENIFSNPNTYILGGLFMGVMMVFMLSSSWM